ncbi:MAG: cytochrome b/b6 domain-containing protein [Azoarcus sp.]|nr:cytochrome b/b6 domain-containing protein [Azoarcus sp.]
MYQQKVWDLPTRLFHWLLAAGVAVSFVTAQIGGNLIEWHSRAGLFVLGLVIFRLVWGVIGSPTARFANFVRGPGAILAYLRGRWHGVGHNPLGALSVIGLLALVGAQAVTGLFTDDDIAFRGPLADLVSQEWSDTALGIHVLLQNILLGLVVLHLVAIVFYLRIKRENLVRPMVTGWKEVAPSAAAEAAFSHTNRSRGLVALVVAVTIASTTVYAAAGGLIPAPALAAPAASGAAPAW